MRGYKLAAALLALDMLAPADVPRHKGPIILGGGERIGPKRKASPEKHAARKRQNQARKRSKR